jgi:glycosyltransferase involved in cell wall biosynthesis
MATVSIITALHNKGRYVVETIRSVQAQTRSDWEMIVVENGSSDHGPEQVRRFVGRDSRIRLVASPKRGPGAARNFGLAQATGDWVLFLDADDGIAPTYLDEQLVASQRHEKARIIAGCWQEFTDGVLEGATVRYPCGYRGATCHLVDSAIAFAPWAVHAALVRRDWLGDKIRWFEHLDGWPSEDTAFWFSALQGAAVTWSESTGAFYRVNTPNSRNSGRDADRWFEGLNKVIETNLDTLARSGKAPSAAQRATIMRTFESRYRKALRDGNDEWAARFLAEATRWLRACAWTGGSIALRKVFGIRLITKCHRETVDTALSTVIGA